MAKKNLLIALLGKGKKPSEDEEDKEVPEEEEEFDREECIGALFDAIKSDDKEAFKEELELLLDNL